MPKKVLVIGIDSMDSSLLTKFMDELPEFQKISRNSPRIRTRSVFPPDSDTAWATIYTGLNPAMHGVVKFVDPLEKSVEIQTQEAESALIQGKTFWDKAGSAGKRVCVLLPHIAYPPWPVNGVMVSKSRIENSILALPEGSCGADLQALHSPIGVPKRDKKSLDSLIKQYHEVIGNETAFFSRMIAIEEWDLVFCYSSALDAIQHYFWNYSEDSAFQGGENPFRDVIRSFYVQYDRMVAELIPLAGEDCAIIVLSDHGHGGRPTTLVQINEILRIHGYIQVKSNKRIHKVVARVKSGVVRMISRHNLGWAASAAIKMMPRIKDIYTTPDSFKQSSSKAYVSDLSGIKAYTYGGIIVNRNIIVPGEYEDIRNNIISVLKSELAGKYQWIAKREDVYSGPYLSKYPDILVQLKEGFGLGNDVYTKIFTDAYTTAIVPGSHRGDTPVFFLLNCEGYVPPDDFTFEELGPLILDLLGARKKGDSS